MAALLLSAAAGPAGAQTAPPSAAAVADSFIVVGGDTLFLALPLEVVGSRVPVALPGVVRNLAVVGEDEAARAPARSTAELLQTVPGVVVSQRQQYGVQSDLTMRGSTFDQVQVLLNGFPAGDPQTGHHALDLPVGKDDIARLEVLPGHGSSLYGAGAFGGTVNVVTRRPADIGGGRVALTGGDNGIWGASASADLRLGAATGSRVSFERFRTDGWEVDQPDGSTAWGGNDADAWHATGRVVHEGEGGEWDVFGAYSDRRYGALDYYAPYPAFEKTKTLFTTAQYRRSLSDRVTVEPRAWYRRHRDEFILFRTNPDAYTNDHVTRSTGGELNGVMRLDDAHAVAVSLEAAYEDIDSRGLRGGVWGEALGSHLRRRLSGAVELKRDRGPWRWQAGGRVDRQTGYDARFSGSGAVSWEADPALTLRASAGSVYRVPTFTDLYYEDPANRGSADLVPETGWTWDLGAAWDRGPWHATVAWFERYEDDLIEWARPAGDTVWRVLNIAEGTTRGAETAVAWLHPAGHRLEFGWAHTDKETTLPGGYEGKYTLLVPEDVLTAQATVALHRNLHATLVARRLVHSGGPIDFREYGLLDGRLGWSHDDGWSVSLAGTNLTDRRYEEVPGVQMPGTVFTATVGRAF
ncbi:TonB-dependent receptor [bacterium]|nr:TonB-dependent receptor [bacterium]